MATANMIVASDARRSSGEIVVRKRGTRRAYLYIDGQLWAICQWAEKGRFCVEDSEWLCLEHVDGEAATLQQAIDLATAMIRDGRMPTPEESKRLKRERDAERDQKRDAWEHPGRLYEPLADALELWSDKRSNTYARLRDELIALAIGAVGHFESVAEMARSELARPPPRQRYIDIFKDWQAHVENWQAQLVYAEEHLVRAREILRTHREAQRGASAPAIAAE